MRCKKKQKNFWKRGFALVLVQVLIFSCLVVPTSAASNNFNDTDNHWAKKAIDRWSDYEIVKGDDTGNFRPNSSITRAEMAAVISKLLGLKNKADNKFSDLRDAWYTEGILKCAAAGIMVGDGNNVRPTDIITREEAAVMLGKALGVTEETAGAGKFGDSSNISSWAQGYVNAMAKKNILNGYENGFFDPAGNMNRASVMTVLDNTIVTYINKPGTYTGNMNGSVLVVSNDVVLNKAEISGNLIVAQGAKDASISIKDSKVQGDLQVKAVDSKLKFEGSEVQAIKAMAKNVDISSATGTTVKEIVIDKVAQGTIVNVAKDASVNKVESNADSVSIKGQGGISTVSVNGNNTSVDTSGTKVTVATGVTGITSNGQKVTDNITTSNTTTVNKPTTSKPGGGGGSSSGGSSSGSSSSSNLTAYNAALAAVSKADYTEESWNTYQEVVKANVVTAKNTQAKVDAATAAIKAAQEKLVFAGQADLDAAKSAAGALNEADYTVEDWAALNNALALPETTNEEIVAKTAAINEAIGKVGELFQAKEALNTQITKAKEIQDDQSVFLHDWTVLADALNTANGLKDGNDTTAINDASYALQDACEFVAMCNKKLSLATTLTVSDFASADDYTALTNEIAVMNGLNPASATKDDVEVALTALNNALIKAVVTAAEFTGTINATNWEINNDGIRMEISLKEGYALTDDIAAYKDAIIDSIDFSCLQFDKDSQTFHTITFDEFVTNVLGAYGTRDGYFAIDTNGISDKDKFVGNGTDAYPGIREEIKNALKTEGTVSVENGKLVISCDNDGYFGTFTNQIRICNGGVPAPTCDLLMSVTIPAGAIKEGVAIKTDNTFNIKEMKMHFEVWEYVDAGTEGAVAITTDDPVKYVKRVENDMLTEQDIRDGGKLIKLVMDVRVGPTQWADTKSSTTFISNMFRTNKDATGYSGNNSDTYTPIDDPEWLKIENALLEEEGYKGTNYLKDNKYYVNYSGNHRMDTTEVYPMWMFIEMPKVTDFNISKDMNIYVNLIGGMVGGSGRSVAVNGQPFAGMDGRYSFTIKAIEE